jgi:hypothetical protein
LLTNTAGGVALVDGSVAVITVIRLGIGFRYDLYRGWISKYAWRVRNRFRFLRFRWHDYIPSDD